MTSFEKTIIALHGVKGATWLNSLPAIANDFAQRWHLRDLKPLENLSYNYVLTGWKDQQPIILKIGLDLDGVMREAAALETFHGYGMVLLLDQDLDRGGILLQRAVPGKTLKTLFPQQDNLALNIACNVIEQMHKASLPTEHNFPLLTDDAWLGVIDKDWDIPNEQLMLARKLKKQLLAQTTQQILLHGDLHYENILSDGDNWLAIDPKGVIGDAIFDKIGCLVRTPSEELIKQADPKSIIQRRIYFN